MLLGDNAAAKHAIDRASAAADFDSSVLGDPWPVKWGESDQLILAVVSLKLGDRGSAERHLKTITTLLDRLKFAGVETWGMYQLRAAVLSLSGDADGAMLCLNRAVELGWRSERWAEYSPYFSALWTRRDFRALMNRVNQMSNEMRANVARTN